MGALMPAIGRTVGDWAALERLLRRVAPDRSWRRSVAALMDTVLWEHGRWVLLPLGMWRCEQCGGRLPKRLSGHVCPHDLLPLPVPPVPPTRRPPP